MTTTMIVRQSQPNSQQQTAVELQPLVYIAAPYTHPDPVVNTHAVIKIADALWAAGFTPLIPHLTMAWHLVSPKRYETWLEYTCQLLARCDVVLRVPGFSNGASIETHFADAIGIPIIHSRSVAPADCVAALIADDTSHKDSP